MTPQTPQQGASGSESSRTTGDSSNTPPAETQPQHRHQVVQDDTDNAATEYMTKDAQLTMVHQAGSSINKKQHAIGCEFIHTEVDGRQLTI